MKIHDASLEDSPALARLQVDSYRNAYAGIFPQAYLDHFTYEEQEQDWRDWFASGLDNAVLCVAEAATGELVGYALARFGAPEIALYKGELVSLHVSRVYQRQGVGRSLVAAVAERLRQRGVRSLMLWVLEENPSRGFYERLGARLLDERKMSFGGKQEVAYGWLNIESL